MSIVNPHQLLITFDTYKQHNGIALPVLSDYDIDSGITTIEQKYQKWSYYTQIILNSALQDKLRDVDYDLSNINQEAQRDLIEIMISRLQRAFHNDEILNRDTRTNMSQSGGIQYSSDGEIDPKSSQFSFWNGVERSLIDKSGLRDDEFSIEITQQTQLADNEFTDGVFVNQVAWADKADNIVTVAGQNITVAAAITLLNTNKLDQAQVQQLIADLTGIATTPQQEQITVQLNKYIEYQSFRANKGVNELAQVQDVIDSEARSRTSISELQTKTQENADKINDNLFNITANQEDILRSEEDIEENTDRSKTNEVKADENKAVNDIQNTRLDALEATTIDKFVKGKWEIKDADIAPNNSPAAGDNEAKFTIPTTDDNNTPVTRQTGDVIHIAVSASVSGFPSAVRATFPIEYGAAEFDVIQALRESSGANLETLNAKFNNNELVVTRNSGDDIDFSSLRVQMVEQELFIAKTNIVTNDELVPVSAKADANESAINTLNGQIANKQNIDIVFDGNNTTVEQSLQELNNRTKEKEFTSGANSTGGTVTDNRTRGLESFDNTSSVQLKVQDDDGDTDGAEVKVTGANTKSASFKNEKLAGPIMKFEDTGAGVVKSATVEKIIDKANEPKAPEWKDITSTWQSRSWKLEDIDKKIRVSGTNQAGTQTLIGIVKIQYDNTSGAFTTHHFIFENFDLIGVDQTPRVTYAKIAGSKITGWGFTVGAGDIQITKFEIYEIENEDWKIIQTINLKYGSTVEQQYKGQVGDVVRLQNADGSVFVEGTLVNVDGAGKMKIIFTSGIQYWQFFDKGGWEHKWTFTDTNYQNVIFTTIMKKI